MSSDKIDSVLHETRLFVPPADFSARPQIDAATIQSLRAEAAKDHPAFWARQAREHLGWQTPFTETLDESDAPHYRWFQDGRLNVSYNCLDRHLDTRGDQVAIVFEGEPGDTRELTYRELHADTCRLANVLHERGVQSGDRVVIYMPMVPEAVIAMQACARIGAIHSVVFGGFSAAALKDRIDDAGAKFLITADGGQRGGKIVERKTAADQALSNSAGPI